MLLGEELQQACQHLILPLYAARLPHLPLKAMSVPSCSCVSPAGEREAGQGVQARQERDAHAQHWLYVHGRSGDCGECLGNSLSALVLGVAQNQLFDQVSDHQCV